MPRIKHRPPRVYKDKGGYYILVNGKVRKLEKKYNKLPQRKVESIVIKNIVHNNPISSKRRRATKAQKKTPTSNAGSMSMLTPTRDTDRMLQMTMLNKMLETQKNPNQDNIDKLAKMIVYSNNNTKKIMLDGLTTLYDSLKYDMERPTPTVEDVTEESKVDEKSPMPTETSASEIPKLALEPPATPPITSPATPPVIESEAPPFPKVEEKKDIPVDKEQARNKLNMLQTNELRQIAENKGLDKTGKKSEVLDRILGAIDNETLNKITETKRAKDNKQFREKIMKAIGGKGNSNSPGLWSDQINDIMAEYVDKGYLGTIAADEIPRIIDKSLEDTDGTFGFIMNLDTSDMEGSHWVAVYVDLYDEKTIEYFDSFGDDPSDLFLKDIKRLIDQHKDVEWYLKMKINKVPRQRENSSTCGYFAIRFLRKRFKGVPFEQASGFEKIKQNEDDVKKLQLKYKKFGYI